ncbi:MAG: hypothetical protein EZS28_002395 [Streblomastix strix]|uniref:Uncharacterized protein n=1 Tax=Streblomastix strix TaxID=222440 RepID=A0A5J4X5L7_9EUKA|nr:MAG: hypothetical protein EZS28_002395 [Streblomastix strix]
MQHSDYVSGYIQLGGVLKLLSMHPQSFEISKQNFFDSPITELTSSGVKCTRAPLGTRATQFNKTFNDRNTGDKLITRTNFNDKEDPLADWTADMSQTEQGHLSKLAQGIESLEHLQFWIGFSTACGPFYQFQLLKDATALQGSAIYAREQAVICVNSLSDLCTKNSVSVSSLESIIEGKRHCEVFINIQLCEFDKQATIEDLGTQFQYKIPFDIAFSGVLDLSQQNPIFNSFLVLTCNYAKLHLQLWVQDFLQDLKNVQLNKNDTIYNNHLAFHMFPPEKPDIVYLLSGDDADDLSGFDKTSGSMQSIMSLSNIKALFMTFSMPQNPTCGCKAIRTLYPDKYMLEWKLAIDDSFMRGYNSSKIGCIIYVMRLVGIIFDDSSMPQVLNIDVIGELFGGAIKPQ